MNGDREPDAPDPADRSADRSDARSDDRTDDTGADEATKDPNARWSQHPSGDAWAIISYLLSGMAVYGGAGWLLDRWLGTGFFLPVGLLGGAGAALYLIWVRYGKA